MIPENFVFSQSSLQDYVDCRRRFKLRHLDKLSWPAVQAAPVIEHEQRMAQGDQFHKMVYQHQVGVPTDLITARITDELLRTWWENYLASGLSGLPEQRHPDAILTAPLGDFRLLARYDLIAVQPGERAVIVDWKTSQHKPERATVANRLQTVVYRYLLVVAGAYYNNGSPYKPEQIEMVYWYPQFPDQPERFPYDAAQFAADEARLLQTLESIHREAEFPKTPDESQCRFCTYRSLCDRGIEAGALDDMPDFEPGEELDFDIDLDQIGEIAF